MVKNICDSGKKQSPINIVSNESKQCGDTCQLNFFYKNSKCNITRLPYNILLDYDVGSYVTYKNEEYQLEKISFTNSSSHKINNISFPLELHLYHRSLKNNSILIIGIFIDINNSITKSKLFLDTFYSSIPNIPGEQVSLNKLEGWNVYNILPKNKSFYTYKGSLLKSPCSQKVEWIIMENFVNCSEEFYNKILLSSKNNAREIQKLNSRTVYYNSNNNDKCTNSNLSITIILLILIISILLIIFLLEKEILNKQVFNKFIIGSKNILNTKIYQ